MSQSIGQFSVVVVIVVFDVDIVAKKYWHWFSVVYTLIDNDIPQHFDHCDNEYRCRLENRPHLTTVDELNLCFVFGLMGESKFLF